MEFKVKNKILICYITSLDKLYRLNNFLEKKFVVCINLRKQGGWVKNIKKLNIALKKKIFSDIHTVYQKKNNAFLKIN